MNDFFVIDLIKHYILRSSEHDDSLNDEDWKATEEDLWTSSDTEDTGPTASSDTEDTGPTAPANSIRFV